MKILFLSQIVPYPPHGGVLQRGYNIIKEISKYNEVHLLAFIHPDILTNQTLVEESQKELGKFCASVKYFSLWPKKSIFHKYGGFLLGFFSGKPFSFLAHKSRKFKKSALQLIESQGIDLVHYDTIALAPYRNNGFELPSVLTHHNIESELMNRRAEVESNSLAKLYLEREVNKLRKVESVESRKFDVNVTMSLLDADRLKELAPGVVTEVVPNGVDIDYFKPIRDKETRAVIYTGGMNMYANKDAVLYFAKNIWPYVKEKIPDIKFYVIGQDPPPEIVEIAARDSGIEVLGYVDDVRPFVAKAGIYIVPLRVGGGTRLKVLDALAQGKAIVSTSVGCEGIAVEAGKNIIIEDHPMDFANQVIDLLQDEHRRNELSNAARELAETHYSWDIMGKRLQAVYEKLAKDK